MACFPDLALIGNRKSPTGGGGVDDFISWVAARWQICSDGARILRNISAGNVHVMSRDRRFLQCVLAGAAVGAMTFASPTLAADVILPVKARQFRPAFDWSGFYVGGHLGYGRGSAHDGVPDPFPTGKALGSLFGGVQLGYNHVLKSGALLGLEGECSFLNFLSEE